MTAGTAKVCRIATLPVWIKDLNDLPITIDFELDDDAKRDVARRLDVPAVLELGGSVSLRSEKGGALTTGLARAQLSRICVASLEPMVEVIEEPFVVRFVEDLPESDPGEDDVDLLPLDAEVIDIAELVVEQVILAMNPYPKRDDRPSLAESLAAPAIDSPFAALARFVDHSGKKEE